MDQLTGIAPWHFLQRIRFANRRLLNRQNATTFESTAFPQLSQVEGAAESGAL